MAKKRTLTPLTPQIGLALSKAIKEKQGKEFRDAVQPGSFNLDALLALSGVLTIAPDTPAGEPITSHQSFNAWELLYCAIKLAQMDPKRVATMAARNTLKAKSPEQFNAELNELQTTFSILGMELLLKIQLAGASPRRGSASFAGAVLLQAPSK